MIPRYEVKKLMSRHDFEERRVNLPVVDPRSLTEYPYALTSTYVVLREVRALPLAGGDRSSW